MNNPSLNNDPIDAVITWVDGNDPKHINKRQQYSQVIDEQITHCAALEGRFLEVNEVKYCIYSIRKFAPWIRNIFLVTDEQCPDWLTDEKKIELGVSVIDHKIIFRDHLQYLPTFNSLSIETLLWKIPGLSDKFIAFNDDFFIINPTAAEDFFHEDKTVVRGSWKSNENLTMNRSIRLFKHFIKLRSIKRISWSVNNYQTNGAIVTGYKKEHFEVVHSPYPAKVSVLDKFYENNKQVLEDYVKHRFRHKDQSSSLVIHTHLALKNNKAEIRDGNDSLLMIPRKGGLQHERYKFDLIRKGNSNIKFLCFQDLYYLKQENSHEFAEVIDYLDKIIMSNESRKI
ncbi:MAG: Stealth CR1 domain-containing protein [Candidatus Cloacimonetes bacterium]|nr:Stealth CR1 domain-containing protein [Candidatus Cloacimonadota bacterium]